MHYFGCRAGWVGNTPDNVRTAGANLSPCASAQTQRLSATVAEPVSP